MSDRYHMSLPFWTSGLQYLTLVENVSRQIASEGNAWFLVREKGPISPQEYDNATMWSDHRIVIPLLFSLFHGLELLVKGFLLFDPEEQVKKEHNLCGLCARFKHRYPNATQINDFLDKFTCLSRMPEFLRHFLTENEIGVDKLYESLRYPSPDFQTIRLYSSLQYQQEEGSRFFSDLCQELQVVRRAIVRLGRSLRES